MQILIGIFFGLIIGSFLNVVIHRLPKAVEADEAAPLQCLLWPASTAPCCNSPLAWYENIPVVSWLVLRGRCRHCGQPIIPRYVAVELFTGLAFGWSVWQFGLEPVVIAYALFLIFAISLFFIDLETHLLPDVLTLNLLWLGLLMSAIGVVPLDSRDAILGVTLGYVLPWSVNRVYVLVRGHDGLGGGDFKLLAALGAWTGWVNILPILGMASIAALLVLGVHALLRKKKLTADLALPFGPFLIFAGLFLLVSRSF